MSCPTTTILETVYANAYTTTTMNYVATTIPQMTTNMSMTMKPNMTSTPTSTPSGSSGSSGSSNYKLKIGVYSLILCNVLFAFI